MCNKAHKVQCTFTFFTLDIITLNPSNNHLENSSFEMKLVLGTPRVYHKTLTFRIKIKVIDEFTASEENSNHFQSTSLGK